MPWRSASVDHAHGDGMPGDAVAARRVGGKLEAADLGRAAADIEDERPARLGHQQRRAAGEGQRRLLAAGDDLDLDAGLAPDAADELGAIVGAPAGFGGDAAGMGDAAGGASCRRRSSAPRWCGPWPRRRARRLAPSALAQPDDAREGIDDAEPLAPRPRHQQPAIVGAEIERGQHSPVAADRTARLRRADSRPTLPFNDPAPRMPAVAPAGAPAPIFGVDPNRLSPALQGSAKDQWGEGHSGQGAGFAGPGPSPAGPGAHRAAALESRGLRH